MTENQIGKEPAGTVIPGINAPHGLAVPQVEKLGRGHEDKLDQGDFEIPRAKVIQFTSDEAQAEKVEDRIPAGTFINGLSKKVISPKFIPILRYKTYTQWNPRKKDDPNYDPAFELGEMVFTTQDRHDPRVVDGIKWGENNETPKVTEATNFLCYFEGEKMPMILTFAKTSYKTGKILNSLLQEAGGDMFSNKFSLGFVKKEKAGTKYYVYEVRGAGKANAEEFAFCESIFTTFRGQDLEAMAQKPTAQAEE